MLRSSLLTMEETTSFLVSCLAATLALVVVLVTFGAVVGVATALPAPLGAGLGGVGRGSGKRSAAPAKRSVSLLRPSFRCFYPSTWKGCSRNLRWGEGSPKFVAGGIRDCRPILLSDDVYPTDKGDICKKSGRLGVRVLRPHDGGPELDLPIHERCAGEVQVRRAVGKRHPPARTGDG
jgi:hypothetical protein